MRIRTAALAAALVVLTSCAGADRTSTLDALVDEAIVPTFRDLAAATADLEVAAEALCHAPDAARLEQTGRALAEARSAWSRSEPLWVGPVMDRRSWAVIDWPASFEEIEALIADGDPITVDRLAARVGADQRGLQAVEYVLGRSDEASVLRSLEDERRCDYLIAITAVAATEAAEIQGDWEADGPASARTTFTEEASASVDDLVNDLVILLEAMTDTELGTALGVMDQTADAGALAEGFAALGLADLQAHSSGIRTVLVGDDEARGIAPLLGDDLADRLEAAIDRVDLELARLNAPLSTALVEQRIDVIAARDALKTLQILVNTEVVSRLGVTIGFSDADGDTGS